MDKKIAHTVFEEIVKKHSLKVAIETGETRITYSDLNISANRISHLLKLIGCEKGTIVNVIAHSSIQLVSALLAIFKRGGIYLPVDLTFSEKRLRQVFGETFNGILIVTADAYDSVIALAGNLAIKINHLIVIDEFDRIKLYSDQEGDLVSIAFNETAEWKINPILEVNGDSSNYIFYTSGSTGEGKAIVGAHASLSHFIHWEIKEFNIDDSFRVCQLTQITFDASLRDIFVALISGGTLCIPPADIKTNPAQLLRWLEKSKISLIHCVPSLFRVLTKELTMGEYTPYDFSHLQYILMAGELLYAKDIINWRKIVGNQIQLVNFYGPTETTLIKTFYRIKEISENPSQIIPAGIPISNTIIAIVNDGHLCITGEMGEIYIKTPFATKGYYKNEKLTNECFVQNPLLNDVKDIVYKTGDLGRFLPDGTIEVLGRSDSQVKVNGIRIELVEVERALLEQEKITGAVVKTHRTNDNLLSLIAYYTGEKIDVKQLRDALGKVLNQQIMPSYFIYLEEFPLNINGKVDKKALPLPEDALMNDADFEHPTGSIENILAEFWKEILGLKKIGRNVSFFSIGGQSLRAIQLLSRIDREFGVNLKIEDVFTQHTIQKLAYFISNSLTTEYKQINPVIENDHYPLSSSQRRLWVLSQFEESNIAYNMPGVYVFEGNLDSKALEYSFNTLLERHESLRTVFKENEQGEIRQFINPVSDTGFRMVYQDLRFEKKQEKKLKDLVQSDLIRPFNLASGSLIRAGLYQVKNNKWVFTYIMHHIINDGWSMEILIKELLLFYNAYIKGENNPLIPLCIHYKDYAVWQEEQLNGEQLNVHKSYWLKQFEGELPVLELPVNKVRPAVKTYNGDTISKCVNSRISKGIKSLSQEQECTLFMSLLAAVNTLLYRYTGQEDIIIGSPIAGRKHIDLEDQIGFYANTLALRTRFKGEESYQELLANIKRVTLDAYEHQIYPFDELVDSLNLRRDMSRNALFDVMIVLQNAETKTMLEQHSLSDLKISKYELGENLNSKFDLLFNFVEVGEEIQVSIEYNSDISTKNAVLQLADHFVQLLEVIIVHPDKAINELDFLSSKEKNKLLERFNDTSVDYSKNMTVISLFEEQVEKTPGKIAVVFEEKELSYEDINKQSNQLARYIQSTAGVKRGDSIGVLLDRSEWSVISMISIMKLGCTYVPTDMSLPRPRIQFMLEDSGSKALIVINKLESKISGDYSKGVSLIELDKLPEEMDSSNLGLNIEGSESSFIIYTSGSTGNPKGVEQTHLTLHNLILWDINGAGLYTGLHAKQKHLQFSSFSFDSSLHDVYYVLSTGGELHVINESLRRDLSSLKDYILEKEIVTLSMPYAALKAMFSEIPTEEFEGHSIQEIISTGEQLYVSGGLRIFLRNNPAVKIHNFYGPSETHVVTGISYCFQDEEIPEKASIGKPIHNTYIYILNKQMQLVPIGVEGEIYIGGWNLAKGYIGNSDLTAKKFIKDPFKKGEVIYHSGDIGKWLPNGEVEYIRRSDDQIKINGYRIELGEIESTLRGNEQIEEAIVVTKEIAHGDRELVAYLVSKTDLITSDVRNYLSKRLPVYMIPAYYVQLEKLPLTSNGKVDKKRLPDPENLGMKTGIAYMAPRNETEAKLVKIWEEILGRDHIGVNDNFFELGGNSLKVTRLITRIKKQFIIKVDIKDVFLEPTIERIAANLDTLLWLKNPANMEQENADIERLIF
jgi:amino acid adenylation domain-containing protein